MSLRSRRRLRLHSLPAWLSVSAGSAGSARIPALSFSIRAFSAGFCGGSFHSRTCSDLKRLRIESKLIVSSSAFPHTKRVSIRAPGECACRALTLIEAGFNLFPMPTPQPPLLQYEKNIASQAGEDGVVEFALGKLPACDKWCVEFGAWDGKYCSNTYALIQQRDYTGVLIECDAERCARLSATHAEKRIIALCRFVSFDGADTLDNILHGTPIPTDFDLLSVDIDGNDYHVWAALNSYRPKLVVIEYNPSIPNGIGSLHTRDNAVAQGRSLAAPAHCRAVERNRSR